ncbi:M23 family metallopeptidase [Hymenobacter sp. BT770]|uniref:M23 family metallopeptidase n=1 Tax=Hymenobacter sp. BT770 TaxID=2886942 RepID=UPI001D112CE9|nr:M23 family metallopeptidase [Hymenobacter sp. BT770]MCC3152511.1 M23 family metallopeptidase [Hymenobacter sp. BT770]MDO3414513.1 M23 family metallopeptidase [Hymenobacter sp. BT770]
MTDASIKRPANRPLAGLLWPFFFGVILLLSGCSKQQTLQAIFQKATPHEAYARQLHQSGLDRRPAGRAWLAAAEQALRDSLVVTLPFTETGYFRPERPTAASYRYAVRAGEQVHVSLSLPTGAAVRVFLDAFEVVPGRAPVPLASADTLVLDFRYLAEADGQHLLRVQPELLAAGRYTLRVAREPSLGVFPVQGRTDAAVGSFWGAPREAGARSHEGIDIFAARGTPAVAATAGFITRTGETPIGGRVVWLADAAHGNHLYYAHLDKQLVTVGQHVRAGDTLGLVGNTGNARSTVPHLHFGIYRSGRGAVDPFPFVHHPAPVAALPSGPDQRGEFVRMRAAAVLRTSVGKEKIEHLQAAARLPKQLPLLVIGQQGTDLRVQTPGGQIGYVGVHAVVGAAATPLRRLVLPTATELLLQPTKTAPAGGALAPQTPVEVLGQQDHYSLLRGPQGETGWAIL